MISTTFIYILAGVSALYLLVFFGLMRIKFFNKARQEYFSYYRKPINEVARGSAMKALFIWRAINIIIYIILIAILIGGFFAWQYFGEQKEIPKNETIYWKSYDLGGAQFKYPPDWDVEKIYYSTPAQQAKGETPENIGVRLFPNNKEKGGDFIAIGGRQISCDPSEGYSKCSYIPQLANFIYTDSDSQQIIEVFDQMLSTFRFLE